MDQQPPKRRTAGRGAQRKRRNRNFPSHSCTVHHDVDLVQLFIPAETTLSRIGRWWHRMCLVDQRSALTRQVFRSDTAIKREISRQLTYYPRTVHPLSRFRFAWECLMIVTFAMAFQLIPYDVMFLFRVQDYYPFTAIHMILLALDFICMLDIVVSFYTGTCDPQNQRVQLDMRTVRRRYLRGWFWIDAVSSAPDPLLTRLIPPETLSNSLLFCLDGLHFHPGCVWDFWSLMSMLKILRFGTFLAYIRRLCQRLGLRRNVTKFTAILATVLTVFHWATCIMFLVLRLVQGTDPALVDERSWTKGIAFWNQSSFTQYLECSYRVLYTVAHITHDFDESMTYDDMLQSLVYTVCGYALKIYLLAELFIFIRILFSSTSKYHEYRYELSNYMRHEQLPVGLQRQILEFYDIRHPKIYSRWTLIRSTVGEQLFGQLRMEILGPMLHDIPLFEGLLSEQQMSALALKMNFQTFMTNDIITRCDDDDDDDGGAGGSAGPSERVVANWRMVFIVSGTVALFTRSWRAVLQLEEGEHFGEFQLLLDESHVKYPNLVATETTDLYLLSREAFDSFLGSYPPSLRTALADRALEHLHEMRQVELSTVLHTLETSETIRTTPSVRRTQPSAGANAESANNQ